MAIARPKNFVKTTLLNVCRWKCGWVLLLAWCGLWSSITLFADFLLARSMFQQLQALGFATVEATVIDSEVAEVGGGEDATYRAKIEYRYIVAGREFNGHRYRHGFSTGDRSHVEQIVKAYPAGRRTTAYYNPADPAESLLSPGLSAHDFFGLLCLAPFNVVFLGSWGALIWLLRRKSGMAPADFRVYDNGIELRVQLPRIAAIGAAGLAALLVSMTMLFAIAFTIGPAPSGLVVAVAWATLIAAAAWAYRAGNSSKHDLVIDRIRNTLTLPAANRQGSPATIPLTDLVEITLGETPSRETDEDSPLQYFCQVCWNDPGGDVAKGVWIKQSDRDCANELVAWLRQQCGLK